MRHIGAIGLFGSATYFLLQVAFPSGVNGGTIDIQLHDTYFVLGYFHASVLITFWSYCIFAFVYQLFIKWKNSIINWTQLICLAVFNFQWIFTFIFLNPIIESYLKRIFRMDDGWTIYLPGLTPEVHREPIQYLVTYWLVASIPILYLLYCFYRTIKNYRVKK